jgi:hypothetical protein
MRFPKLQFRNGTKTPASRVLPFPAAPQLRTALLSELKCFDAIAFYSQSRWRQVDAYAPHILAGKTADLSAFAQMCFAGTCGAGTINTGVFALTEAGDDPLSDSTRLMLWRAFRAPVQEVFIDRSSGVLASECEARSGWHIRHRELRFNLQTSQIVLQKNGRTGNSVSTGLMASGLDGTCPCGDDAPLIRDIRRAQHRPSRVRAVSA